MRLSEAILLGSTQLKAVAGVLWRRLRFGHGEKSGRRTGEGITNYYWRWLYLTLVPRPCQCQRFHDRLRACDGVTHLFDDHIMAKGSPRQREERWTLEQLVDWVRSVEPADQAEKQALNLYAPACAEETAEKQSCRAAILMALSSAVRARWSGSQALRGSSFLHCARHGVKNNLG